MGEESAVAAARCPPTPGWNNPMTLVRLILQLLLSCLCASAVVVLCRYDNPEACGACQAEKMLGVDTPMMRTAKTSRTFRQIATFAKVRVCQFFEQIPHFVPSVFSLAEQINIYAFANTLLRASGLCALSSRSRDVPFCTAHSVTTAPLGHV